MGLGDLFDPNSIGGMFAGYPQGQQDGLGAYGGGGIGNQGLVGLGLGLLQNQPGNRYGGALAGYQAGATLDQKARHDAQVLEMQRRNEAFRQAQAGQAQSNWEREFALRQQGEWTMIDMGTPLDPRPMLFNKRTQETRPIPGAPDAAADVPTPPPIGPGGGMPPAAPVPYAGGAIPQQPAQPPAMMTTAGPEGPAAAYPGPNQSGDARPVQAPQGQEGQEGYRDEAFLRKQGPNAQIAIKGIAEYQIDPASYEAKQRELLVTAAKRYRPDYNSTEFQKRGSPPPAEVQSRTGLARDFLENSLPNIRPRIEAGELTTPTGKLQAQLGQGGPGEIRRALDAGSEALLRSLTGAGMNHEEASNYARRYQFSWTDRKEDAVRKLNELESQLRYVNTEVGRGRGGDDFTKGFKSKFGSVGTGQQAPAAADVGTSRAPVRVSSPTEALKLPRGTPIILPDGSLGRVP